MTKKSLMLLIMFFCIQLVPSLQLKLEANDDFRVYPAILLKTPLTSRLTHSFYHEMWLRDDGSDLYIWFAANKLHYTLNEHLEIGVAHTYLESEKSSSGTNEFKYQNRLEFEVNPKFKYKSFTFINRNRLEFRWIEGQGSDNTRGRHRLTINKKIANMGPLKSIEARSELFYLFHQGTMSEYRSAPIALNFQVCNRVTLKTFYQIQNLASQEWESNHFLGILFTIKLSDQPLFERA